ncbi:HIT family protein [Sulfurospirillum cavolei]|uniref:HIT family protein n=1 Tax=Sulfurospirillum cavolei TaxID=366522 RepID=UPI00076495E1|nr:HIT family protein [Sulfurospirillum cavolei]
MNENIYENDFFYLQKENASIPWVKIFSRHPYKELSDCDEKTRCILLDAMLVVEKTMLDFYAPDKINIAMFGNYVPHLHIHVMARFQNDTHFPESMWGVKQREAQLSLPSFETFVTVLRENLSAKEKLW